MKKKIFSIIGVAAFAVAVAFNISAGISNNAEMDLTLANVEALAQSESGNGFSCVEKVEQPWGVQLNCYGGGSLECKL